MDAEPRHAQPVSAPLRVSRKRSLGEAIHFNSDTERVQYIIDALPSGYIKNVDTMKLRLVKNPLVSLGFTPANLETEANPLREQLKSMLSVPCAICNPFSNIVSSDDIVGECVVFLKCGHTFHHLCLHSWAQEDFPSRINATPRCPICRTDLF